MPHRRVGVTQKIHTEFPGATWVQGGARGFDLQVAHYARHHGIPCEAVLPDYSQCKSREDYRRAPLNRNVTMLQSCDLLVACYDGRERGGTYYCTQWAGKHGLPVRLVPAGCQV